MKLALGWLGGVARSALILVLLTAAVGCQGCHPSPAPVVNPIGALDAASTWDGSTPATCLDWCRRMDALGCPAAKPTPAGTTCLTVCQHYQDQNIAKFDLTCRTSATVCDPANCQ